MKVQAQHLKCGDIVGSGETVCKVIRASTRFNTNKVQVILRKDGRERATLWGKRTEIAIERNEK